MMSEDLGKSGRRSCFLVCVSLLVLFGTVLGFIAGLLVGGLLAKHGQFASQEFGGPGADIIRGQDKRQNCRPEIGAATHGEENKTQANICSVCSQARVVQVSGADYADCNGLYSLTNLSSVWDTKHIVYSRLDTQAQERRFIYWNSHFYGSNFYGWSIGDLKSLTESGPFHSQGRGGVANQPWLGSWNDNVTVSLVACGEASPGSNRVKQVNPSTANIREKNSKGEVKRTGEDYTISNNVITAR